MALFAKLELAPHQVEPMPPGRRVHEGGGQLGQQSSAMPRESSSAIATSARAPSTSRATRPQRSSSQLSAPPSE